MSSDRYNRTAIDINDLPALRMGFLDFCNESIEILKPVFNKRSYDQKDVEYLLAAGSPTAKQAVRLGVEGNMLPSYMSQILWDPAKKLILNYSLFKELDGYDFSEQEVTQYKSGLTKLYIAFSKNVEFYKSYLGFDKGDKAKAAGQSKAVNEMFNAVSANIVPTLDSILSQEKVDAKAVDIDRNAASWQDVGAEYFCLPR